ncbi:MAG: hypothetical protein JF888_08990 [Candidatus Dormibacteraeota bacterium]|uniref:Uncharacterized protein n=1 Tax=Candidatus Dormiibacter inghamiae TaxID=3127013 RepID=A0A934NHC5_9BACT|nr:hypothetical protein [Candidatus Dormibacteraeota bacterium]MBJ7606509.1 hypothetical protein [Candidatus Dormibacteraeota bacterium]
MAYEAGEWATVILERDPGEIAKAVDNLTAETHLLTGFAPYFGAALVAALGVVENVPD